MEESVKKQNPTAKVLKACACLIGGLLLIAIIAVMLLWHNEIATLNSMELMRDRNDAHKDGAVYTMKVSGGFYLEDFIAQGGVKNDKELISFITGKITRGLIPMNIKDPTIGCASFTAETVDGDQLFARNYDFSKTNTCIVFTEGKNGRHSTISTVDLQFLGMDVDKNVEGLMNKITCLAAPYTPLDGINDAGVSCGIYMSYQGGEKTMPTDQNTDLPDITSTTLLRLILDYADNVEEAIEIAQSYDMHDSANTSYHYMIADASGKSVIFEYTGERDHSDNDGSARKLNIIYSENDERIGELEAKYSKQAVTNFILQPDYYEGSESKDKKGVDRYERIWQELDKSGCIVDDDTAAMRILQAVGRRAWDSDDSNTCTVHSVIYNLTQKTMTWVPNENFDDASAWYVFDVK